MSNAESIQCDRCGRKADPVHHCEEKKEPVFRGFFCPACGNFMNPTGREVGLGLPDKHEDR